MLEPEARGGLGKGVLRADRGSRRDTLWRGRGRRPHPGGPSVLPRFLSFVPALQGDEGLRELTSELPVGRVPGRPGRAWRGSG